MPVHDWKRVTAGTFHDFHLAWIAELRRALNGGLLPSDYYAMAEQRAAEFEPDLLTLERRDATAARYDPSDSAHPDGGTALATARPAARLIGEVDDDALYALKRRTVTIRHATNDRIVALIEIASPGNQDRAQSVKRFVDKAVAALQCGYHLVVVELFRPRASGPGGLASAVWEAVGGEGLTWPAAEPLSAASFRVSDKIQCYAEPFAIGSPLPPIPLFYDPDWYVSLPLEQTYRLAYDGVPRRWKQVIAAEGPAD